MVGMVIDGQSMCRVSHEDTRTWWSSVSDLVQLLTQQADYQTARKYWNKLKESLSKEGSERMQEMADRALAPDQGPHLLAQFQSAPDINAGRSRFAANKLSAKALLMHSREPRCSSEFAMRTCMGQF